MITHNVEVKRIPSEFVAGNAWSFLEDTRPLWKKHRPNLVLDFSDVRVIDRSGILVLVKCFEGALKQNGDVKLASVPAELLDTLQQTGLDQICDIYESSEEARESFYDQSWMPDAPIPYPLAEVMHSNGD